MPKERLATLSPVKAKSVAEIEEIKSNKNAIQERYQTCRNRFLKRACLSPNCKDKTVQVTDIERPRVRNWII